MEDFANDIFPAIQRNDIHAIERIVNGDNRYGMINALNEDGKSTLQVALENENHEIANLLLESRVNVGTSLLRMIELADIAPVELICRYKDVLKENKQNIFDSPLENDEYAEETTPLILAAEKNNYEMTKILMSNGATMPSLDDLKAKHQHLPMTDRTRIIYRYYKAISSEAYLLQTKGNLATDIFNICKQIKREQRAKKGMNDEFTELTNHLDLVTKRLFDYTRNEDEVRDLFAGEEAVGSPVCQPYCQQTTIPLNVKDALLLNLKGFLSHDKCQAALADDWYRDFFIDIQQSIIKRSIVAALLMCLYPVFCVLFILCPCGPMGRFMTVPFVKFVIHSASRLTFLGLLIYSSIDLIVADQDEVGDLAYATDDELRSMYLTFRGATLDMRDFCVFIWIIGMTWREISDVSRLGRKLYLKICFSFSDILQLLFYWVFITMSIVTDIKAYQTVYKPGWVDTVRLESSGSNCDVTMPPWMNFDNSPYDSDENSTNSDGTNDTAMGYAKPQCGPDVLLISFADESRNDWSTYDPLLVAEAAFALANVLTFVRLLHTVVLISGRLGVLQISLIGMVGDICKFLILFFMIWISFSLGLTQLYRPFEEAKFNECHEEPCPEPAFRSLFTSMKTLFWALFGMNELEDLQLSGELRFTETVGHLLFAMYLLVCVIVLLNALIAMMSNTYAKIEENAEVEWKFCRSKMMTEYIMNGAVLPPPFNLLPTMSILVACFGKKICKCGTYREAPSAENPQDHYQITNRAIIRRFRHEIELQQTIAAR